MTSATLPVADAGPSHGLLGALDLAAIRRFHLYTDVLLVSLAWLAAYWTRSALDGVLGYAINTPESYIGALPGVVVAWIASCWIFGIYETTRMKSVIDQIQQLLKGVILGFFVISSLAFFFKELDLGRTVVVLTGAYSLVLQGGSRAVFFRIERRLQRSGRYHIPTLILGAGTTGIRLLQKIQDHPELGHRVVGFLDDDPALADRVSSCPVLGGVSELRAAIREHGVEEIFIAMPSLDHTRMLSMVLDCEDMKVTFRVVTKLFEVLTSGSELDLVDELPLVKLGARRVSPLYGAVKRSVDFSAALVGLLLTTPLWLYWILRIRLDSPGPAFFVHERIGLGGAAFRMWKFRTMQIESRPQQESPRTRDDPRVTRYGAWLRRTSIDELPQFLNVLRGEMSLVGPRPEMPFIVEDYDEWQRRRLTVLPGITGLWQILGRKDLPLSDNLHYDFYYIRNRSLWLDFSLLLRTLGSLATRKGAY
jgi:exopolysaccharide biosynthesis polyprenyl glycosylphosphotransferase